MATVAAGTFKTADCTGPVMDMTGTTVFTLGVYPTAAGHSLQITVTLFAITVSRLSYGETGEFHTGLGAKSRCAGIFTQDIIVRSPDGGIDVRAVANQAAQRLAGIPVCFVGMTGYTDSGTPIGGIFKISAVNQRTVRAQQSAVAGIHWHAEAIRRGGIRVGKMSGMAGSTRNITTNQLHGRHHRGGKFKRVSRRHNQRADRMCQAGTSEILVVGHMTLFTDNIVSSRGTQELWSRDHICMGVMTDRASHQTCGNIISAEIEGRSGMLRTGL